MTNRQLIQRLLYTNLDEPVDMKRVIGDTECRPEILAQWVKVAAHTMHCSNCNVRVSDKAYKNMHYCFNCSANMQI